jgi:hypothetical protein
MNTNGHEFGRMPLLEANSWARNLFVSIRVNSWLVEKRLTRVRQISYEGASNPPTSNAEEIYKSFRTCPP